MESIESSSEQSKDTRGNSPSEGSNMGTYAEPTFMKTLAVTEYMLSSVRSPVGDDPWYKVIGISDDTIHFSVDLLLRKKVSNPLEDVIFQEICEMITNSIEPGEDPLDEDPLDFF